MKTEKFREYLIVRYPDSLENVYQCINNCSKVEKYHGNLDTHFTDDNFEKILFYLTYTTDDARSNRKARHRIPTDGNIKELTDTYKKHVNLYKIFLEQTQGKKKQEESLTEEKDGGFTQTNTKEKKQLSLRSIDQLFESEEELDEYFENNVEGYSESPDDVNNCEFLAYRYFKNYEGEWYFRTDENNTYVKIIPAFIERSSRLKTFFSEMFERTVYRIECLLEDKWSGNDDELRFFNEEEIYFEMRDEDDIRKNITG